MMEFGDQDLRLVLNRALRSVMIAIAVGIPISWIAWGWRSMLLFLVGGGIAATSILEWRQLMTGVLARLDFGAGRPEGAPKPLGGVLFWFFIRLIVAGGVLYVSLRSLDGKVAALLIGLGLGLAALFIEALRLLRGWSA
jgi:hypothetical protein